MPPATKPKANLTIATSQSNSYANAAAKGPDAKQSGNQFQLVSGKKKSDSSPPSTDTVPITPANASSVTSNDAIAMALASITLSRYEDFD